MLLTCKLNGVLVWMARSLVLHQLRMDKPSERLLSQGTHQIELYVEDTEGANHIDSVSIQVREPNEAPTCEFISPEDATIAESGDVIQFQALVSIQMYPAINLLWSGPVIKMEFLEQLRLEQMGYRICCMMVCPSTHM